MDPQITFDDVSWDLLKSSQQLAFCNLCSELLSDLDKPLVQENRETHSGCVLCDAIKQEQIMYPESDDDSDDDLESFRIDRISRHTAFSVESGVNEIVPATVISIRRKPSSQTTSDPYIISFIESRLKSCLGHRLCREILEQPSDRSVWPARMVKILGHDTVRIVSFDVDAMAGKFAALSYCWGPQSELSRNPPYKLTSSTFVALQSGVSVLKMPLTLQHSFTLCKRLGIDYIWIDSLCILQAERRNDLAAIQDWTRESTKMETVYAKSTLTIIAASGNSCHSGFLETALKLSKGGAVVNASLPHDLCLVAQGGSFGSAHDGFHSGVSKKCPTPLSKRAWCYQEEVLSSRYIKFTGTDIQWKCHTAAECMCGTRPTEVYLDQWRPKGPAKNPISRWAKMVQNYSNRSITVHSDRLVGISGLARMLEPDIKDRSAPGRAPAVDYYAGIWTSTYDNELVYQLTWIARNPGSQLDSYIAPSFSWASIDTSGPGCLGVEFDLWECGLSGTRSICQVNSINTTPTNRDYRFGAVSAGFITIRGLVRECLLESSSSENFRLKVTESSNFFLKVWKICNDCPLSQFTFKTGNTSIWRSESRQAFDKTKVKVLLVAWGDLETAQPGRDIFVTGLLLAPQETKHTSTNGMTTDVYRRLGIIQYAGKVERDFAPPEQNIKNWGAVEEITIY
ncbi:heterokaryon incompatibility protein-domain-containing protein [Cladorrhinum sp. PSN259]|nr:heterokaryon incompatibility protein-domain-containing protein [Cladorrhinum sp. PSN259]